MGVLVDSLIGAVSFGLISYISQPNIFGNNKYYFQIFGFLWTLPITYFFYFLLPLKLAQLL